MKKISLLFLATALAWSCDSDIDDGVPSITLDTEIKDFVWKGMNTYYLWQGEVSNLSDTRFASSLAQTTLNNDDYAKFLANYSSPIALFEGIMHQNDRFSFITDDYEELEGSLQGVSLSSGMDFGLVRISSTSDAVLGFVRYVLPNTDAERKGIKRGDIFLTVDGVNISVDNYRNLLYSGKSSLTIGRYALENNNLVYRDDVLLQNSQISENPVHIAKVLTTGNHKIGYLMYNAFINTYDVNLNEKFAYFKSENITDLVLDLRYNGGGHISSATHLASMITGQFNGELFAKERWNSKLQPLAERERGVDNFFVNTISLEGNSQAINSLGLERIYIITSDRTASASELVINGLKPYISVTQVGTTTVGKNQGSITVYDWIDQNNRNPKHKWAMQPIVLQIENADGFGDYTDGLEPNIIIEEDITKMGELGTLSDPLLERTINAITGQGRPVYQPVVMPAKTFASSKSFQIGANEMISDRKIIIKP